MALTIPNIEAGPTFDAQSVPDATDWATQSASESGTGVISGMTVSPSSLMTVAVASGVYVIAGVIYTYAGGTVAAGAASSTDRRDIVTINAAGTLTVTAGTACGTAGWTRTSAGLPPVKPAIPSGGCLLGELYVANTTTTVASGNIIDKTTLIGWSRNVTTLTGTSTLGARALADYVVFLGTGAVPTMPTAVANTNQYTVKNTTAASINLASTSSQTFDGNAGPLVIAAGVSYDLISDGANWRIV